MNWGKVVYVFFTLTSLTTISAYLYEPNVVLLFIIVSLNLISGILQLGVRNIFSSELFASSLVSVLHLSLAFVISQLRENSSLVYSLVVGASIANIFSLILFSIESAKSRDEY